MNFAAKIHFFDDKTKKTQHFFDDKANEIRHFFDDMFGHYDGYYLWIASYNHEPVLPGDPHYDIWQFSRHGRVPGVWNWVDLNRFADGRTLEYIRIKEK